MRATVVLDGEGDNAYPQLEWADYPSIQMARRWHGKDVAVTLEFWRGTRTQKQNRFWWGVVVPTFMDAMLNLGNCIIDKDEAHEALKLKFHSRTIIYAKKPIQIPKSTANLSKEEFTRLVQKVEQWLAEANIYLPQQWEP